MITDVLLWGGTPWLRAKRSLSQVPALKDAYQPMEVDTPPMGHGVSMLSATVELTSEEQGRQHALRGHSLTLTTHIVLSEEVFQERPGET